jgi:serine/threonine protein kinase
LRKAIDLQIARGKSHQTPPFPPSLTIVILFKIERGMNFLHENGILHRDLKAANVLVVKELGELKSGESIRSTSFACDVTNFESPEGTLKTGFWRAPEVLLALQNKVVDKHFDPKVWTKKADVYSYAMTSYEVLSSCIPFHNRALNDYKGVIEGERPSLPDYVDSEMRELVGRCWHSEPLMRPTFEEIQERMFKFLAKRLVSEGDDKYEWDCSAKRVIENKCCYLRQAQEWVIDLGLTPKVLRVFFIITASKQPLFKAKLPQNSPYSKQGGFRKLWVPFSTSNREIL